MYLCRHVKDIGYCPTTAGLDKELQRLGAGLIMSLTKLPFIFLFGWGVHIIFTSPNSAATKVERTMLIEDGLLELFMGTFIPKDAYRVHAAIELLIILAAAAGPRSTLTNSILTFLLPHKDPSRIFLSPMGFLATVLMVIGAIIRSECYRELGKHFRFQVTILKNHKLVTSGPYSYVRHPSYTGAYICFAGIVIWYTAQGSWLRESEVYKKPLAWIVLVPVIVNLLSVTLALFRRIPKEDEILKETFGKEWDEWAKKAPARLFPGIY